MIKDNRIYQIMSPEKDAIIIFVAVSSTPWFCFNLLPLSHFIWYFLFEMLFKEKKGLLKFIV